MLLIKFIINNGLLFFVILFGLRNILVFIDGVCFVWLGDCSFVDYVEYSLIVVVLIMWYFCGLVLG